MPHILASYAQLYIQSLSISPNLAGVPPAASRTHALLAPQVAEKRRNKERKKHDADLRRKAKAATHKASRREAGGQGEMADTSGCELCAYTQGVFCPII